MCVWQFDFQRARTFRARAVSLWSRFGNGSARRTENGEKPVWRRNSTKILVTSMFPVWRKQHTTIVFISNAMKIKSRRPEWRCESFRMEFNDTYWHTLCTSTCRMANMQRHKRPQEHSSTFAFAFILMLYIQTWRGVAVRERVSTVDRVGA